MGFELLEQVIVELSDMLSNLVNQSETVLHPGKKRQMKGHHLE